MTDLKALEALLERRRPEDAAEYRKVCARIQARALLNLRFAMLVERYREADPAAVAPRMGVA